MAEDFKAKFRKNSDRAKELLGYTDSGFERLGGLQKRGFDAAAKGLGVEAGKDANETAGNIVSKVTSGLGNSTAADVLRAGLQTGATVALDPMNFVAPGKMAGTIAKVAEKNAVRDIATNVLKTGDLTPVKQIVKAQADGMASMAGQYGKNIATQGQGLGHAPQVISSARVPNSALGPNTTAIVRSSTPKESVTRKMTTAAANNEGLEFSPMTTKAQKERVLQILEDLKRAK